MEFSCKIYYDSIVNVYRDSELMKSCRTPFGVTKCPKVCISQRACHCRENPLQVKIIINIVNYEPFPMRNLQLRHTIFPAMTWYPGKEDRFHFSRCQNTVILDFPCIMPLSMKAAEAEVVVDHPGQYTSQVSLVQNLSENSNRVIQDSICNWVIG